MELPACILVDPTTVECDDLVIGADGQSIRLMMASIQSECACPKCGLQSSRIHSCYYRRLADLPWATTAVQIDLEVRRFFCDTPSCEVKIFAERLPTIAAPWARRTARLAKMQRVIDLSAGGSVGSTLCTALGCSAGVDLIHNLVRSTPLPNTRTPRVLGVDDWAKRKGQSYGTILIDHERECVVDLLPDRAPEIVAKWLREHPGVEIVTRDRAEAYAQGICDEVPDAIQVADRWHLLQNLTDVLFKVFQDHRADIQTQLSLPPPAPIAIEGAQSLLPKETLESVSRETRLAPKVTLATQPTSAGQRRQDRAQQARELYNKGWQIKDIADHLHCAPKTISRYLNRQLPLAPRPPKSSKLDDFKDFLVQRWNEGCHNAVQLLKDIRRRGFTGGRTILREFVAELRQLSGIPARSRQAGGIPVQTEKIKPVPSSRKLAWLSMQREQRLDEEQKDLLRKVGLVNPALNTAIDVAKSFTEMVVQRKADKLDTWLATAEAFGISALKSFADGLRSDYDAVKAALTLSWSNDRTEGNVNRLKTIKRQMYGRGKLDLLRLRLMAT